MQAGDFMQQLERVQQLQDGVLIERLTHSVRCDRRLTVRLLVEMGEVAARGLFRDQGFSTMFEYATRKLGMSEAEAVLRMRAAKLGRRFPVALEMLGRNELHLTTLSLLAPVLTADNLGLLYEARFKSKQQVLELLARHAPKPDVPDSVRPLPSPRPSARAKQPPWCHCRFHRIRAARPRGTRSLSPPVSAFEISSKRLGTCFDIGSRMGSSSRCSNRRWSCWLPRRSGAGLR